MTLVERIETFRSSDRSSGIPLTVEREIQVALEKRSQTSSSGTAGSHSEMWTRTTAIAAN
jgi:hypothetical protein